MEPPVVDRGVLVGRSGELGRIAAALAGSEPVAFVLAGAPGVGKTRLASEAARNASAHGYVTAEAVASNAARTIPFGTFAHLLPVGDASSSRFDLLRKVSVAIFERAGSDGRLLLVVDDAHLLDDGSAALVHQLVLTGVCSVIATVRTHEPAPDPVTSLWKDNLAERIELDPLDEAETGALISSIVGGPVSGATTRRLWELSQGNVLYLRELLIGATGSGALAEIGGIWSLEQGFVSPERLVELIAVRLDSLAPETVAAIQLVAAGEPLPLSILEQNASPATIENAEHHGFIEIQQDGRRTSVRVSHPLYGEAVRQMLPSYRRRRIAAMLAEGLLATGWRRREDLLRLACWQLDAGVRDGDGELLGAAARKAIEMFDMEMATRLAESAIERGAGVEARIVLGEAKFRSGHAAEADVVLADIPARCTNDLERARVASARAHNLHVALADPAAAEAVLDEALATITDPAPRLMLLGRQATMRLLMGSQTKLLRQPRRCSTPTTTRSSRAGATSPRSPSR